MFRSTDLDVVTGFLKIFQSLTVFIIVVGEDRFKATFREIAPVGLVKLPGDHVLSN